MDVTIIAIAVAVLLGTGLMIVAVAVALAALRPTTPLEQDPASRIRKLIVPAADRADTHPLSIPLR